MDILSQLTEWKVEDLGIITETNGEHFSWEPYIFKSIEHIDFSRMRKFQLKDKHISSL